MHDCCLKLSKFKVVKMLDLQTKSAIDSDNLSAVKPGIPLSEEYTTENLELIEKGCENLIANIETVKKSGVRPVVCVNSV